MFWIYGIIFFGISIGSISVSDISLIMLTGLSIYKNSKIRFSKKLYWYIGFLGMMLVPFILYRGEQYFDTNEYILSMIKVIFYFVCYVIIPQYLEMDMPKLYSIILNIVRFTTFLGFYQILDYYVPINLYSGYSEKMSLSYGIFRFSSVYSEPSLFFFTIMLYFYLLFQKYNKMKRIDHVAVFAAALLTVSMTVYIIYVAGVLIYYYKKTNGKINIKVLMILLVLVIGCIVLYSMVPIVQTHINNLLSLRKSSATTRVLGWWEYIMKAPFWGIGAGNEVNYFVTNLYGDMKLFSTAGVLNNILGVVIVYSGVVGVIFFLVYLLSTYCKICWDFLLLFFVSFFAWGHFNTAAFCSLFILLNLMLRERMKCYFDM